MPLKLSRRKGERIEIGDAVVVEVIRVTGKTVVLAVDAPIDVAIKYTNKSSRQVADTEAHDRADEQGKSGHAKQSAKTISHHDVP